MIQFIADGQAEVAAESDVRGADGAYKENGGGEGEVGVGLGTSRS